MMSVKDIVATLAAEAKRAEQEALRQQGEARAYRKVILIMRSALEAQQDVEKGKG
jgi:hypothetical protein